MTTKYFVSSTNKWLGAFDGEGAEATLPPGAVEVSIRPGPLHIWDGAQWIAPDTATIEEDKRQRSIALMANVDVVRLMFEAIFNHENRLRVLEGASSITRVQLRDAIADFFKKL